MGNLVDHFIIRLKPGVKQEDVEGLLWDLPENYRGMFQYIWKYGHFARLKEIMDKNACFLAYSDYPCFQLAERYERDYPNCGIKFSQRYREESLLQVLRRTFYDTLLILKNSYDWNKENQFTVVEGEIISEEEWMVQLPEDQQFRDGVITNLVKDLELDEVIIP